MLSLGYLILDTKQHYKNDLCQLFTIIEGMFVVKHPKVVWANLTALAFFCQEYAPEMQKYFHEKIIEYIMVSV